MTKEEVIKEAWGDLWDLLKPDEKELVLKNNGFFNGHNDDIYDSEEVNKDDSRFDFIASKGLRPYELENIENNNSWIKIECEKDLPKIEMQDCFIMDKTLRVIVGRFTLSEKNIWLENATHYQPIEKPKPPIY